MRSIWTGSISFGLVNIPIKLYSATEDRGLHFNLLTKDGCKIHFARICRETGQEIPYDQIVRGYEYEEGEYVVLDEADFEKADVRRNKTVDIEAFVQEKEIDPKLYKVPYYLEPAKGAQKPYALLREALAQSKRVALGKFVLRHKEILCVLRADGEVITLVELRFHDEVRSPENLDLPQAKEVRKDEAKLALQLVEQLSTKFEPEHFKDEYTQKLRGIIERKARGERVVSRDTAPKPTRVSDLVSTLRASLEEEKAHAK